MAVLWRTSAFQKKGPENPIFIVFLGWALFGPGCQKREILKSHPKKKKLTDNWKAIFLAFLLFLLGLFFLKKALPKLALNPLWMGPHSVGSWALVEHSSREGIRTFILFQNLGHFPHKKIDEGQITHLICARLQYDLYDFFRGCFGPASCSFSCRKGPKNTPPKSHIDHILGLQTRPPGTEVKSADVAQSALERVQKVFGQVGTKGSMHWRNMGLHGRKPCLHRRKWLLGGSRSLGPTDLLHPRKATFSHLC